MNVRKHLSRSSVGLIALLHAMAVSANVPISTSWCRDSMGMPDHASEIRLTHDAYGRLRAPVFINGAGPFEFIVDTGANGSVVARAVADRLDLPRSGEMLLRGVTGSEKARAVLVDSLALGDLRTSLATLLIGSEALEGADGFLGTGSLLDMTVLLDFRRSVLAISESEQSVHLETEAIPIDLSRAHLTSVEARINDKPVTAIIDTGAGGSIGNRALLELVLDRRPRSRADQIVGTTEQVHDGNTYALPPVKLGSLWFAGVRISIADVSLFQHFDLTSKPALIIGMDVLSGLDAMSIDYGARVLRIRARRPACGR